jgi:hypothetical protein
MVGFFDESPRLLVRVALLFSFTCRRIVTNAAYFRGRGAPEGAADEWGGTISPNFLKCEIARPLKLLMPRPCSVSSLMGDFHG